ncbi:maleylpyruvate isomerase family mycothiol-dependent enzyme [Streptomyces sp. NPDC059070]|uniref:maleylpyruvate isomerase family mycothiol-dependent enzyme n=1 Tax=unclassified Streptomyces TaxID=2593676 RepID=UPI0034E1C577
MNAQQPRTDPLPPGLDEAIRGTAEDIAVLLRGAGDTGVAVPGLEWTLGETAAHLAQANLLMAELALGRTRAHGDGTPGGIAEANARALAEFDERAAEPLAATIVATAAELLDAVAAPTAPTTPLATPMGTMDLTTLGSYLLTHMLGHGYDIARAVGRPHMVDRRRADLCVPFMVEAMPRVVEPTTAHGLNARYTVRLWGGSRFGVVFTDGVAEVAARPVSRPDCTISIEPVTFLLMALGRIDQRGALARGRVLAWGRKPWLAPRFPTLFTAP